MKCLSVAQPFADLIISGRKTIELRTWNTNFRGEFLVHAPLKVRNDDCARLGITKKLPTGVIVGKATLHEVRRYESATALDNDRNLHHAAVEFGDRTIYGFLLKSPKVFDAPIPYKGMLGLFEARLVGAASDHNEIVRDILDEEHRYRLIGRH